MTMCVGCAQVDNTNRERLYTGIDENGAAPTGIDSAISDST